MARPEGFGRIVADLIAQAEELRFEPGQKDVAQPGYVWAVTEIAFCPHHGPLVEVVPQKVIPPVKARIGDGRQS
jgi:hypothetical protein